MSEGRAGDWRYATSDEKNAHEATAPAEPVPHRDYGTYDEDRVGMELAEGESALEAEATGDAEAEATGDAAPAATGDGVLCVDRSLGSSSTIILDGAEPLPCMDLGILAEVNANDDYLVLGAVASGQVDGDLAAEPGGLHGNDSVAMKQAALYARIQTVDRQRAVMMRSLVNSADADPVLIFYTAEKV